ncbi:MAG: HAD hydrolase-like protein [Gemmatimonadota bacterium]
MSRLVLFDIDGTILSSNRAAPRAFRRALKEVFGTSGPTSGYSFAGRTDPQIARDLLRMAGLEQLDVERGLDRLWTRYLELLEQEFRSTTAVLYPGVHALLDRFDAASEEPILGLLTGNVREGARLKLASVGIEFDRFRVGAFGSDHHDRSELPAIAVERAEAAVGHRFEGKSIVIIGDTPSDISCGEHLGVRTIAVATGSFSAEELARCRPDHLFEDLSNTGAVWEAIFE